MLSAIAIFGLVGGALAFTVAKMGAVDFFTCNVTLDKCVSVHLSNAQFTISGNPIATFTMASKTIDNTQTTCITQGCVNTLKIYSAAR